MTVKLRSAVSILPTTVSSPKEPLKNSLHCPNSSHHPIASLLQRCCGFKDLESLYATMIKNNAHQDPFSMNQFLTACSRFRLRMDFTLLAFTQMAQPNIFVYNAVMGALIDSSAPAEALHLFVKMPKSLIRPTRYTFSYLVKACQRLPAAIGLGEAVHGQIRKMGFGDELVLQTGLIGFYLSLDRVVELRTLFNEMGERDAFSWNTMIFVHARLGELDEARRLFDKMTDKNIVSWNTMIGAYAKSGDVGSAARLFDRMPSKNLVSWTSMLTCYSRNGHFKEAIDTFEQMKLAGTVTPDKVTMAAVISACAHLGSLEIGRKVHHYAILNGFELDVYMGSALIDMYAKCGNLERSLEVFFVLEERNLFCWNAMIDGLAVHGQGKDALEMFYKLENETQLEPNGVTFVSVLSSCTHSGLVAEGREMFSRMVSKYSISPELEHYCCMVDLLGRAGLIGKALEMVRSMEMEPNAVIWRALLGACRIHGNVEIGNVVVDKLLALEPNESSNYVLLVNMYAKVERWGEVASVRGMMRERAMVKSPGCSWIHLDGLVHEFTAADMSHPLFHRIYILLLGLDEQLKLAGDLPVSITCHVPLPKISAFQNTRLCC